jgi:formylglycine-generating enzyme
MAKPVVWGRAALSGAALVLCVSGCDSVLGIEEPQDKPTDGGEAGEEPSSKGGTPSAGGTNSLTPQGGEGGDPLVQLGGAGGAGGEPPMTECTSDAVQCGGDNAKTPQICDETGHWVANTEEASGECADFCDAGKCTECEGDETRCSDCYGGEGGAGGEGNVDPSCDPRQLQKCDGGVWVNDGKVCDNYCAAGKCQNPASCLGAGSRGICSDDDQSCCQSLLVPGGEFKRDFDAEVFNEGDFPARISPFFLDKFEVTVGRMKQFVGAYATFKSKVKEGDGKSDHVSGDTGWSESYALPADAEALTTALKTDNPTWSDEEENIRFPVNSVPFNVAYAFCIWDGGRLPTEPEWNFAASGGNEQRTYPWGPPPSSDEYGYFGAADHLLPSSVGLFTNGNGRWGHADLSGNVSEWVLDYYYDEYPPDCEDCLASTASGMRVVRGVAYTAGAENQYVAVRTGESVPRGDIGFRCARDFK